jgi:hypothetical protein
MQFPYMTLARPDHEDRRPDDWNLNARLALWMSVSRRESTSFGRLQLSSHIYVLERNPITDRTLSGVRTCCWNVWTDASWSNLKLSTQRKVRTESSSRPDRWCLDGLASGRKNTSSRWLQEIQFHWFVDCTKSSRRTLNSWILVKMHHYIEVM